MAQRLSAEGAASGSTIGMYSTPLFLSTEDAESNSTAGRHSTQGFSVEDAESDFSAMYVLKRGLAHLLS